MYENEFINLKCGDVIITESEYYSEWFRGVELEVVGPLAGRGLLCVKPLKGENKNTSVLIKLYNSDKFRLLKKKTISLKGV